MAGAVCRAPLLKYVESVTTPQVSSCLRLLTTVSGNTFRTQPTCTNPRMLADSPGVAPNELHRRSYITPPKISGILFLGRIVAAFRSTRDRVIRLHRFHPPPRHDGGRTLLPLIGKNGKHLPSNLKSIHTLVFFWWYAQGKGMNILGCRSTHCVRRRKVSPGKVGPYLRCTYDTIREDRYRDR
ncbi:hypothetical protein B0H14DRAFT_256516 [Mycena olivaceomarginata]|nr:hypothetical protein B0H14DRAFT_256516 [Mycena olivaceomarginata]